MKVGHSLYIYTQFFMQTGSFLKESRMAKGKPASCYCPGASEPRALVIRFLQSQNQRCSPPSMLPTPSSRPRSSPLRPALLQILTPPLRFRCAQHLCLLLCSRLSSFCSVFNAICQAPLAAVADLFTCRCAQVTKGLLSLLVLQSARRQPVLRVLRRGGLSERAGRCPCLPQIPVGTSPLLPTSVLCVKCLWVLSSKDN